jgi:3-hydroxyisobutyrate dehydrogenase-like beta-hydroxyacid dehydrogenase
VRLCLDEAEAMGVPMWVGSMVRQMFQFATNQQGADADFTTIVKCIEQWAGVEVRARGDNST